MTDQGSAISSPQYLSEKDQTVDDVQPESSEEDEDETNKPEEIPSQLDCSFNRFLVSPNIRAKSRVSLSELQVLLNQTIRSSYLIFIHRNHLEEEFALETN